MSCIGIAQRLKSIGFDCWWFDADIGQARQAYERRGRGTLTDFDRQVAAIHSCESQLRVLFPESQITTLDGNGVRKPPEEIWPVTYSKCSSASKGEVCARPLTAPVNESVRFAAMQL